MGTPLGPKYIPYIYMDPLGMLRLRAANAVKVASVAQDVYSLP